MAFTPPVVSQLPYVVHGAEDATPTLFLPGLSDSLRSFEPVLASLPHGVRGYAVTQRGHAGAPRPGSYRLADYVADVVAFMDGVGLESAVVAGHSLGSVVAARLAIDHPERVDGLVLMGAAATFTACGLDGVSDELAALSDPVDAQYIREFQLSTLASPIPEDFLETVCAESAKVSAEVWSAAWDETVMTDFSADLGRIAAPTLLAWGDRDSFSPREQQEALLDAIPGARLRVYDGRGHAFHWESPAVFAADLGAFVESLAR
jgi:non-heme chloroperoxidase